MQTRALIFFISLAVIELLGALPILLSSLIPGMDRLIPGLDIYDDPAQYQEGLTCQKRGNAGTKWGMDESIWPRELPEGAEVLDYKMIRYDPWDAQYLGYLVLEYAPEDYAAEKDRLEAYPSTEYLGYYGVTEPMDRRLLAIYADSYNGFVYALEDGDGRIVYVELIFCNYYMDLPYKAFIPEEYLLEGFDASQNNPYMKEMIGSTEELMLEPFRALLETFLQKAER